VTGNASEPLLLDEIFSPALAEALCADGFDVVAVAGHPLLAAAPDRGVAAWAVGEQRRLVTENVPLLSAEPAVRVLLASSRGYPRSRSKPWPAPRRLAAMAGSGCDACVDGVAALSRTTPPPGPTQQGTPTP